MKKNITLKLNEQYPFFGSEVDSEIMKMLIDYANRKGFELNINNYDLIKKANDESLELLIEYAIKNNIALTEYMFNNLRCYNVLLYSVCNNRDKIVKLIMDYADQHFFTLKMNIKNSDGKNLINMAYFHDNVNMVKLMFD